MMIQFCYNDNVLIRNSVLRVFEAALKLELGKFERQELIELFGSVPHILHSQLLQDVSSNNLAFKDMGRDTLSTEDFKRAVE